jgi:hypothetical protein
LGSDGKYITNLFFWNTGIDTLQFCALVMAVMKITTLFKLKNISEPKDT